VVNRLAVVAIYVILILINQLMGGCC